MAKRSTAGLMKYVKFLMEAGVMERPLWLDALEKVPPMINLKPGRRPPTIRFPEDDLVRAYYRRNPAASLEPVDLGSFEPNTARRFAARQMQLIEQGVPRREARLKTEAEFADAAKVEAAKGGGTSILSKVQREEESHLKQAMQTYIERHGHGPLPQQRRGPVKIHNSFDRAQTQHRGRNLPAPPVKTPTA